jgi:hypothetical protein
MRVKFWIGAGILAVSLHNPLEGRAANDENCFKCTTFWDQAAQASYHTDWYLGGGRSDGTFSGNYHPGGDNWSNCINAISVAGHILYGGGEEEDLLDSVESALASGGDSALLSLLAANSGVELNRARGFLQVVNSASNRVVYQVRLQPSQLDRLAKSLIEKNAGQ